MEGNAHFLEEDIGVSGCSCEPSGTNSYLAIAGFEVGRGTFLTLMAQCM